MPKEENDWNYDEIGFLEYESDISFDDSDAATTSAAINLDFTFWSKPQAYNGRNNLGIKKQETYMKCFVGQADAPDPADPYKEISLSDFTTDKPRKIDLRYIEADSYVTHSMKLMMLLTLIVS